jgi:predicted O-methyltransferase YrrM
VSLKNKIDSAIWRLFGIFERAGVHVTPISFNSPIPDFCEVLNDRRMFEAEHPMTGVEMGESEQVRMLHEVIKPWETEYIKAGDGRFGTDERAMGSYAPFNALMLYAFIRHFKPKRMVEVGSGMSTKISAAAFAVNRNEGHPGEFVAIEPFPSNELRSGYDGLTSLLTEKVEHVPTDAFTKLGQNDMLFIDSSHTVRIFGDVNYLFLSILPLLKPGVIIHVHDIFFPREYLPHHFTGPVKQIWQEQYLLHAFLMFNSEFKVTMCSSYLHFRQRDELRKAFGWYHENRCPSSFWMTRKPATKAREEVVFAN